MCGGKRATAGDIHYDMKKYGQKGKTEWAFELSWIMKQYLFLCVCLCFPFCCWLWATRANFHLGERSQLKEDLENTRNKA